MAGKGADDTRSPNREMRRKNHSAINWCKHEWYIRWELEGEVWYKCSKCAEEKVEHVEGI